MSSPTNTDLLLDFPSVPETREAMTACISVIDAQLDEIEERKERLQATRAALAALTGTSREGGSRMKQALNGADRQQYEGEGGDMADRRVPRRVDTSGAVR